jgi:hypothetical protein
MPSGKLSWLSTSSIRGRAKDIRRRTDFGLSLNKVVSLFLFRPFQKVTWHAFDLLFGNVTFKPCMKKETMLPRFEGAGERPLLLEVAPVHQP